MLLFTVHMDVYTIALLRAQMPFAYDCEPGNKWFSANFRLEQFRALKFENYSIQLLFLPASEYNV